MRFNDRCDGDCAVIHRNPDAQPLRISLQRWGLAPDEALAVLAECPADSRLAWRLGELAGDPPDVVVHLVDAQRLAGDRGGAVWNAMGPVQALRRSRQRGSIELAVVDGNAANLPAVRAGCWVLSGQRGIARTLALLTAVLTDREKPRTSLMQGLQRLASLDATVTGFALHARSVREAVQAADTLQTLAGAAVVDPVALWLNAPAAVLPLILPRLQGRARTGAAPCQLVALDGDDDMVRGLIALPWPDLAREL